MGKRKITGDKDDVDPSSSKEPATIGQKTSHIRNKQVRSKQYNQLRHEKNKKKKQERQKRQKEDSKAIEQGTEPPPKKIPKVRIAN